jgi:hypothetical protein
MILDKIKAVGHIAKDETRYAGVDFYAFYALTSNILSSARRRTRFVTDSVSLYTW